MGPCERMRYAPKSRIKLAQQLEAAVQSFMVHDASVMLAYHTAWPRP